MVSGSRVRAWWAIYDLANKFIDRCSGGTTCGHYIIFLLAASTDIYDHWQRLPKRCATDAEINDYMFRWISKAGRAVVFTRDHTWALRDGRIKELLLAKAKSHELTMCLPKHTDLTRELKTAGAEILVYERLKYTPKARFTIIKDGRGAEAQVAIGKEWGLSIGLCKRRSG